MKTFLLETKDLNIGYRAESGDKVLGVSLNLKLEKGKLVALLGPNGSGKSTLIRSISGLLSILGGSIFIEGDSIDNLSRNKRAQKISVVLTDSINTVGLSVFEVVSYGRFPYTNWLGKLVDNDIKIIEESLKLVDMLDYINRKINTLSDGERQRVMIAKALAQQSDIVILDEPTAHLDLVNRVEMMKLLRKLAHEQNKAILLSTHELDLAMQSADILWLMSNNQSISVGAPEDLILNNAMQQVFAKSSVDFDHLSGMFKIRHDLKTQMSFKCDDAQVALWTKKALEKIGIDLIKEANNQNAIQYLSTSKLWNVTINGVEGRFSSLGELIDFVTLTGSATE
jgi:iron complex transport system ATP-binding protein